MKFSIIVPCYNAKKYINTLFDMLSSETYTDYEVILVDDHSKDGTYQQMCELKEQEKYSNFKVFQTPKNGGPGPARNFGVQKAQGEYILFCDSDDGFDINCLLKIDSFLKDHNDADLIVFPHEIVRGDKVTFNDTYPNYKNGEEISKQDVIKVCPTPWAKVFKTSIVKDNQVEFPARMTGEDLCFLVYYTTHIQKAYKLDFSFYRYIMTEGSITHRKNVNLNEKTTFELLQPIYQEYFPEIEVERFVNSHLLTKAKNMTDAKCSCKEIKAYFKKENKKYPNWLDFIDLKNQSRYRKMIYKAMYHSNPIMIKFVMYLRRKLY